MLFLYSAAIVAGSSEIGGSAAPELGKSGGRLGGTSWFRGPKRQPSGGFPVPAAGNEAQAGFDATREDKESWVSIAKDVVSRLETPGITWNLKPERTHLKFRKIFYPLGITKLSIGADFNPLEASWRVHTSWRDQIVGGDLQLQGTEISLTKDFAIDESSSLWLRGAFDWRTQRVCCS